MNLPCKHTALIPFQPSNFTNSFRRAAFPPGYSAVSTLRIASLQSIAGKVSRPKDFHCFSLLPCRRWEGVSSFLVQSRFLGNPEYHNIDLCVPPTPGDSINCAPLMASSLSLPLPLFLSSVSFPFSRHASATAFAALKLPQITELKLSAVDWAGKHRGCPCHRHRIEEKLRVETTLVRGHWTVDRNRH